MMAVMADFDLDTFLALPRVDALAATADGSRLVAAVSQPAADGKSFVSALWELDPAGGRPPHRLSRSAKGESSPWMLPDGSVLFVSARPDPDASPDDDAAEDVPRLWILPARGGEARMVAAPPAGVDGVAVARDRGTIALATAAFPRTGSWEEDAKRREARKEVGVTARLFEHYPIRNWDDWLGPQERRLHVADPPDDSPAGGQLQWTELTPAPGRTLDQAEFTISADGSTVVSTRWTPVDDPTVRFMEVVAFRGGQERVLAASEAYFTGPACSPDGSWVVCVREPKSTPEAVADRTLWLIDFESGKERDLLEGFDRWPTCPVWAADSSAVLFTADDGGHTLPFRADIASGRVTRLAGEGAFTHLCPTDDGRLFALRSTLAAPPHAVVMDAAAGEQRPTRIPTPGDGAAPASHLERITVPAEDGTQIGAWLVVPPEASAVAPAPLVLFIHGGPLNSWSGWHWRWNPHLLAAAGYAVVLPDPGLSTGYGIAMTRRGWGRWGAEPYTDLMAVTDAVVARNDIDGERTVAMGGSFGGYMANWIAGHTDRFRAIVTHASLWDLEAFHGTTDFGVWWEQEFGDAYTHPERYREWSPHRFVDRIRTPMLVVHGELDYRVPIGEALALWTDLRRHGVPSRFLYFPDENHWVLKPQHARLWYETVLAFLDEHVRDGEWRRPELL
jgi:dipeptidyl aminopeptidase/acylaminoacyl peptidase